jgi:glyoxylase-like metal-dependent hydrolase (beta-lactamase superfamily II)
VIKINSFDEVTRFDLARSLPNRWRYWTTAYLVDRMMVDTGCAHTALELLAALEDKPVTLVVNTHTHEDHIGANGDLQARRSDIKIFAHPLALPILADPRGKQPLQPYRKVFWGWPKPSYGSAVPDGAVIETEHHHFQVIYTPGHTPDHVSLYEPERGWLFTGDLFVGGKERALGAGYDIWQIIASLKRIKELPARRLFPASAQVRDNPKQELSSKITYLEELGGRVLDLQHRGWGMDAIVRAICGGTMQIEWITLGHFSRKHLVLSYLGKNQQDKAAFGEIVR